MRGKTVFVTGAARGIGAASAERMYARGANVALVGLEPERLRENAERLGERAAWFEADVTDIEALEAAVAGTVERFGGIDVAIANAGIAFTGTLSTAPIEQVERTLAVNLLGVWRTDRAVLGELRRSRGYLLNIASLSAISHTPMMGPYTSAKAGVEALSDALRLELAPHGVGVGCAYFGFLDTDLVKASFATPSTEAMQQQMPDWMRTPAPLGKAIDVIERGDRPPLGARVVTALGRAADLPARPAAAAARTPGAARDRLAARERPHRRDLGGGGGDGPPAGRLGERPAGVRAGRPSRLSADRLPGRRDPVPALDEVVAVRRRGWRARSVLAHRGVGVLALGEDLVEIAPRLREHVLGAAHLRLAAGAHDLREREADLADQLAELMCERAELVAHLLPRSRTLAALLDGL